MFRFSLQLLSKTFLIPGNIQRCFINVHRSSCNVSVIHHHHHHHHHHVREGLGVFSCSLVLKMKLVPPVGPLLPFEEFTSVLMSPGLVTGPSQGESSGGAATLMPLDLHAFLWGMVFTDPCIVI